MRGSAIIDQSKGSNMEGSKDSASAAKPSKGWKARKA
jgi:hypothetical protein